MVENIFFIYSKNETPKLNAQFAVPKSLSCAKYRQNSIWLADKKSGKVVEDFWSNKRRSFYLVTIRLPKKSWNIKRFSWILILY